MGIYVIGAGGHAKVVVSTLRAIGSDIAGVLDEDVSKIGSEVLGVKVIGVVADCSGKGNQAVIAIGNNKVRHRMAAEYDFEWIKAIHPSAVVETGKEIRPGTVIFAGVVVQPDTVVGRHAILNTSSSIDHDCVIGDFSHIAPGAHLAGNVVVGEGAFVGTAALIPSVCVGAWSTVGAGAVVIKDVAPRTTVAGNPARPIESP